MASKNEFLQFKKKFLQYQEKFGMTGWRVDFIHEDTEGDNAIIGFNQDGRIATVGLSNRSIKGNVLRTAKHEAIHLLLSDYNYLAHDRYTTIRQIEQTEEGLVMKLANLIPDI